MHSSGSLIRGAVEDIRMLLNEAILDSKYSDQYVVRTALAQAMANLFSKTNQVATDRVYIRMPISIVAGQQYYVLPPCVEQVHCIRKYDEDGNLIWDWRPRSQFNGKGPAWSLQHRTLSLLPLPSEDIDVELWYTPSAHINMHYAEDGEVVSTTTPQEMTLSATPLMGLTGKGENEYVGSVLRSLDTTHAERLISAYNPISRVATLRNPLPSLSLATDCIYEVVPAGLSHFWAAAASLAALRLGIGRKIDGTHYGMIVAQHKNDLKALRDTLSSMAGRFPSSMDQNTIDNPDQSLRFERSDA